MKRPLLSDSDDKQLFLPSRNILVVPRKPYMADAGVGNEMTFQSCKVPLRYTHNFAQF